MPDPEQPRLGIVAAAVGGAGAGWCGGNSLWVYHWSSPGGDGGRPSGEGGVSSR